MVYSPEVITQLESGLKGVLHELQTELLDIVSRFAPLLREPRAREFATQGVGRRLAILRRCILNVYNVFPPDRTQLLGDDERSDIEINLHAFMINITGAHDNIAWVYVIENHLLDRIEGRRAGVGLFLSATQKHLPRPVREYLCQSKMQQWHKQHSKEFRDALAHRIPLYVPPHLINPEDRDRYCELDLAIQQHTIQGNVAAANAAESDRDRLTRICNFFTHSLSAGEESPLVRLHPQLIADARTVLALGRLVFAHIHPGTRDVPTSKRDKSASARRRQQEEPMNPKCPDHDSMEAASARTVSGMGAKPRLVRIRYVCPKCGHRQDQTKEETRLSQDERNVWVPVTPSGPR